MLQMAVPVEGKACAEPLVRLLGETIDFYRFLAPHSRLQKVSLSIQSS